VTVFTAVVVGQMSHRTLKVIVLNKGVCYEPAKVATEYRLSTMIDTLTGMKGFLIFPSFTK
jgi:hypothetical protein